MSTTEQQPKEEGARSLGVLLNDLSYGEALPEMSEEFHALLRELRAIARQTNVKATGSYQITLAVTVKPEGEVDLGWAHKRTAKKPKRSGQHFWLTKGGNLTQDNPKQTKLPLREVPRGSRLRDDEPTAHAED